MRRLYAFAVTFVACAVAGPAFAQDDAGTATAPEGWTCTASYYGSADGCDCGCGIPDPDCPDESAASCTYDWCEADANPSQSDPTQCEAEEPAAPGWTCPNGYYGGGDGCDCGCGAPDPDCASNELSTCQYNNCDEGNAPTAADPTQCAPGEWTPPASDGEDPNAEPPAEEPTDPTDPGTPSDEPTDPAPTTPEPEDKGPSEETGGIDLNDTPPARDAEQPRASGGCSATPVEPLFFGLLALVAARRRRS